MPSTATPASTVRTPSRVAASGPRLLPPGTALLLTKTWPSTPTARQARVQQAIVVASVPYRIAALHFSTGPPLRAGQVVGSWRSGRFGCTACVTSADRHQPRFNHAWWASIDSPWAALSRRSRWAANGPDAPLAVCEPTSSWSCKTNSCTSAVASAARKALSPACTDSTLSCRADASSSPPVPIRAAGSSETRKRSWPATWSGSSPVRSARWDVRSGSDARPTSATMSRCGSMLNSQFWDRSRWIARLGTRASAPLRTRWTPPWRSTRRPATTRSRSNQVAKIGAP